MDTKPKALGLLSAFGVVREAFKIVHSQAKFLETITLVFIVPLALINLVHGMIAQILLSQIISNDTIENGELPILQSGELLLVQTVYPLLSYALLIPSMSAVIYTVATADMSKRVLKFIPAVWKRMVLTCLCYLIINFLFYMAFAFALCLRALCFILLDAKLAIVYPVALLIACMVLFRGSVYMRMVWQVATVASVIEEEYCGLQGMQKSLHLMEGKSATAWVLTIPYLLINGLLAYVALEGNGYVEELWAKIAFGTACVVMASVVALMEMLTQIVFYFVCKAYHGESIEGYPGEYQAVNDKDIESLQEPFINN